jgi:hypothetical protein
MHVGLTICVRIRNLIGPTSRKCWLVHRHQLAVCFVHARQLVFESNLAEGVRV